MNASGWPVRDPTLIAIAWPSTTISPCTAYKCSLSAYVQYLLIMGEGETNINTNFECIIGFTLKLFKLRSHIGCEDSHGVVVLLELGLRGQNMSKLDDFGIPIEKDLNESL